jgi:membrane-bound lytic murein transglycosylase B
MKHILSLALCFVCVHVAASPAVAAVDGSGLTSLERQRETTLRNRLCANEKLTCSYVDAIFGDPRLTVYPPPEPAPAPSRASNKTRQRSPYLTERFGLLTPESLESCRSFVAAHALAFDAAYKLYGVPREIVCGHLRLETDFGIPTGLSPHPLGTVPDVSRLVSLYVRQPLRPHRGSSFARRQEFAVNQLGLLLAAAAANGWDLFAVPGSPTGAIGLSQFEPSAFSVAVDGDGDGKINLFDPEDAILSVAHYLVTRGWDASPEHQKRAIYAYYGGHYDSDPYKFYMNAVLQYASEVHTYLRDHPIENALALPVEPPAAQAAIAVAPASSTSPTSSTQPDASTDHRPAVN